MNGLQIGDTNITKISGPVSMYFLRPKQEIYDNGGADNFPLFLLFGDVHESKENSCDPCNDIDKNSSCYRLSDEKFLKLLDTLSSDQLPIDFYTEYKFKGDVTENKEQQLTEMIQGKRLWCYNMYRTDNKFNSFKNNCPTNKIRWHVADIRRFGGDMNINYTDDIATDLLKNIDFSIKYQDYSYIENQIYSILEYFSDKENIEHLDYYKKILTKIFNGSSNFKTINDFKELLLTLCDTNDDTLNIEKFANTLFYKYINENENSLIFKQIMKQDYPQFKDINFWCYLYKKSLLNRNFIYNITDLKQVIEKLDVNFDFNDNFNYKCCNDLMMSITSSFIDLYTLARIFKKPVTKQVHDTRSTLDIRSSLSIGFFGNFHIKNIVDLLLETGYYNLEHKIDEKYFYKNEFEYQVIRCINIDFKLNLESEIIKHNTFRNNLIKINIFEIIKNSKIDIKKIYPNIKLPYYGLVNFVNNINNIKLNNIKIDNTNYNKNIIKNYIALSISSSMILYSLVEKIAEYLYLKKKIKINSVIVILCFFFIHIINPKISIIYQIVSLMDKYFLNNAILGHGLNDILLGNSSTDENKQLVGGSSSSSLNIIDQILSSNLINKDIKQIIKKIIAIFTEYFEKEHHTLDDLRNIIKKNLNIDNDLNEINNQNELNNKQILKHDEIIDITNSKYLEAYNKLKNTIPYKLSSLIDNKVISIIKKIEYNKQLIDKQTKNIFEYSNAIKNVNSNKICDNIDFDKNNLNEITIDNCLTNYKKLIKEKKNNIKEIKIILDNI